MFFDFRFEGLPRGSLVLVEGDIGLIHRVYGLKIASDSARQGRPVMYVTPESREGIEDLMRLFKVQVPGSLEVLGDTRGDPRAACAAGTGCLCIDPVSYYWAEARTAGFREVLEDFVKRSREGTTVVLVSDTGVLEPACERLMRSLADGIIQIQTQFEGVRIKRYLYIPKMKGMVPVDRMVPFTVTEEGIQIDPRERHG
jgi:KaiC/GvpD/RAD55 family RecA-like ATPase